MFDSPFQGTSLVDDVGEVGFRSDPYIKFKFKPCFMTARLRLELI